VRHELIRYKKTPPLRRPLSMFTDQAFIASSKAVNVIKANIQKLSLFDGTK